MTAQQHVEVAQRWRSRDKRDNGRTVEVIEVDPSVNALGNGFVTVKWVRRSRMRAETLRRRYTLAQEAPQ